MIKTSIIISFYKRTDYLALLFAGLEKQSFKHFEVIIADDGSSYDKVNELEYLCNKSDLDVKHIWHEDIGFRKNKILNEAIKLSESDYLVFIDGDCVPHKDFIYEHFSAKENKVCLTGRRVNLSENFTSSLNYENVKDGILEKPGSQIIDGVFGKSFDVEKGIYLKNQFLRSYINKKKRGILGCNFSIHKKDLLAINGFDERYEAPSIGEDSDIQYRLELIGVNIKSLNNIAVQYHLYHKLQTRPQKNLDLFEKIKQSKMAFTPFGIVKSA